MLICIACFRPGSSQEARSSAEIYEAIEKLKVLGSVLYVAAHPDDENTRLITHLSRGMHLRTAYVSLTRGDGGQNLIGEELDEFLGAIRTQELQEARRIDGGIQYFSLANDFGYSKNDVETFRIWPRDSVSADLIRVVRSFKPDVIINRFDHRTSGRTHGHHTASAILGREAFLYCNSPLHMRELLEGTEPHLVQRLFFNTSYFFYGRERFDTMDKSHLYRLDVGDFYPLRGQSNNEIAAQSRSMHKSQGFGINSSRGSSMEYFERIEAGKETGQAGPFDGLDFSWNRVNGGGTVSRVIDEVIAHFDILKPWKSIPLLQKAEQYMEDLTDHNWKQIKLEEIRSIILDCAGIYAEAHVGLPVVSPGGQMEVHTECIARNPVQVKLRKISVPAFSFDTAFGLLLEPNIAHFWQRPFTLDHDARLTAPFWLMNGRPLGYYPVEASAHRLLPERPRTLYADLELEISGKMYTVRREIVFKTDDPVLGEVKEPLDVLPSAMVVSEDPLYLTNDGQVECSLRIRANCGGCAVKVRIEMPQGVRSRPESQELQFERAGEEHVIRFSLSGIANNPERLELPVLIDETQGYFLKSIKYPHIQQQRVLTPARLWVISSEVLTTKKRIAYIEGAGDYTDDALRKMGYDVRAIQVDKLDAISKKDFDVLLLGIRAFNTRDALKNCKPHFERFVSQGGKIIVQYNTTADLVTRDFAPAALTIGRGRVADERAAVRFIAPDHPALQSPNVIGAHDFDNWVQERGLYFPSEYDSSYAEILGMNDPGEKELRSGLLVSQHGKGAFVYTSLAWFRQLRAGVPGAYRLFSNLVSF